MRISLNWLQELVDINMTPTQLADMLTMAGFEVEDIEDRRTWADGVVVGRVLQRDPHPNADKLSVCQVDIGTGTPSTIVCGASNVRADIYVPVATVGTYLPKIDLKIRPRKLRDVPSEGMICSLAEVGLAKESAGIHIFPQESLEVGSDARPLLGLDDVILDLTSTANRADALSMVGIAREIAALTGAPLKLPNLPEVSLPDPPSGFNIQITETTACPLYIGTAIAHVTLGPSPEWLQRRLQSAGTRPINNVVDITNYVLLEWGQPLHAFDGDRLQALADTAELTLGVRYAQARESLTTLDGQARTLSEQALVITANDQPVALAGVMGGENTEVHDGTQSVLLEAAYFDPAAIRRSARSQGLRTEASARYERGVNPAELRLACLRALDLLTTLAGGTVISQVTADHRSSGSTTRTIELRLERINQLLGPVLVNGNSSNGTHKSVESDEVSELQAADVEQILTALGCNLAPVVANQVWSVTVPPYRMRDLEREVDLIEEVARLYGYNNFCDTLPGKSELGYLSIDQLLIRKLHTALRAVGLTEVMHYSVGKRTEQENQVILANPLFTEFSALRTELMPALIDAFQYNLEQGNGPLWAFEMGRVFWREEDGLDEADYVAGVMGGDRRQGRWVSSGREQPMTWFEAKGILDSVFQQVGVVVEYQPDRRNPLLHPGRTASLWIQGNRLGTFGQLHPQERQRRGLPDEVYAFEMNLDVLLDHMDRDETLVPTFQPYSTYPSSDRDIAFFVPIHFSVSDIQRTIRKAGGTLLESIELFDEYRGDHVPSGKRSLALRLVYRASDRTLTDDDVEPVHQRVREALEEKYQVELRS